jgi:hypothetical protein
MKTSNTILCALAFFGLATALPMESKLAPCTSKNNGMASPYSSPRCQLGPKIHRAVVDSPAEDNERLVTFESEQIETLEPKQLETSEPGLAVPDEMDN